MITKLINLIIRIIWFIPHWIAHGLKQNQVRAVSWHDNGKVFTGLMCCHCKKLHLDSVEFYDVEADYFNANYKEEEDVDYNKLGD